MKPDHQSKWFIYAPLTRFVVKLAEGWNLQDVCEPMQRHHGNYSVLMWRSDEPHWERQRG